MKKVIKFSKRFIDDVLYIVYRFCVRYSSWYMSDDE